MPPRFMAFRNSAPVTESTVSKWLMRKSATKSEAGSTTTMKLVLPMSPFCMSFGTSSARRITPAPMP